MIVQWLITDTNKKCLIPGYRLRYRLAYSKCHTGSGLSQLIHLNRKEGSRAILGPICENECEAILPLVEYYGNQVVTFGCRGDAREQDIKSGPSFVRTSGNTRDQALFVLTVINHFGWNHGFIAVLRVTGSAHSWGSLQEAIMEAVNENIQVHTFSLTDTEGFEKEMKKLLYNQFVFVLSMYPEETVRFLNLCKDRNFYKEGVVFIVFDFVYFSRHENLTLTEADNFTGILDITANVNYTSPTFIDFFTSVFNGTTTDNNNHNNAAGQCLLTFEPLIHLAQLADAMSILIEGMRRTATEYGDPFPKDSDHLSRNLANITIQGVTGVVSVNNFTAKPLFMLHNFVDGCYFPLGRSRHTAQAAQEVIYEEINGTVIWPGRTKNKPTCPEHLCNKRAGVRRVIALCIVGILIEVCVIIGLVILRRSTIRDMGRGDWIITSEALYSVANRKPTPSYSKPGQKSDLTFIDDLQGEHSHDSLKTLAMGQIFAKVTVLDQQFVAIKSINKESVLLNNKIFAEVNQIRNLRHTNVNQLVGACVEPGTVCLVWGYGDKGSLRDVLSNHTFRLDWMFQISFITDIARGMAYIHSSPVSVHGCLKSSNVIVDKNWCCKLTDMAMPMFRLGEYEPEATNQFTTFNLLWVAPELLRLNEFPLRATKKGDVYAFAIIIQEILTRGNPFSLKNWEDPEAVLYRVINEEKPPFRPSMSVIVREEESLTKQNDAEGKQSDYGEVVDLMVMCWDEYPLFRLPFTTIGTNLKKIRRSTGTAMNLADEMLAEMTKYTDLLEQQVEERTLQIQDQQEKADELIARMLPKSVTQELKMGKTVVPESYQSVTIFFSDIVGFTALAAKSTPLQVVTLLNDLYTIFDNVVDDYDAYKIETIGDAYMVVSGLPVRNGDLHAGEIASAALRILGNVLAFHIRHCPDKHLLLRIGLHTGPVVAGVVGVKMPRYCLFGDTVTYASRMESNGLPLHIHISEACKENLDKLTGFQAKLRGKITVVGWGEVSTYFLESKTGLSIVTPILTRDVLQKVGISITMEDKKKQKQQQQKQQQQQQQLQQQQPQQKQQQQQQQPQQKQQQQQQQPQQQQPQQKQQQEHGVQH